MSQRMSQPTRHPAIWLDATYTVPSAAEVTGLTVNVIYGAIRRGRLKVSKGRRIAGIDLWKFWRAGRRRMRLAAKAAEGGVK